MIVLPVLVRPRYPGNVGAAARVAANFAAPRLVVVAPTADLDDPDFVRMSMGAEKLVAVEVVDDLAAAVADADLVIGTTSARRRDPRGLASPEAAAERIVGTGATRVAVVFGPERSGLRKEELARCQLLLSIPTSPTFPVLNLAQAVGIVLFALSTRPVATPAVAEPLDRPAGDDKIQAAMAHLHDALFASGFLDQVNSARVMDQLRRLFGRAVLTGREVTILRGIASHVTYLHTRGNRPKTS